VTPADRAHALLADIEAAPDELAAVIRAQAVAIREVPLGALARPSWRLTGMGSSRFAALDAAARLRAAGRDAHAELASASGASPGGTDTLVVAISSSGRTAEVVAAAGRHRGSSYVLALTARGDSALAEAGDAVVPLAALHAETSGVATMTCRATVTALAVLADDGDGEALRARLASAPDALRALLAGRDAWLARAADVLDGGRPVHVLGDGFRAGAVEQAALMLREGPRLPASAWDTGDWLHVGQYTLVPGDPVLLLAGSPADAEAVAVIRARGGRVVAVGGDVPDADVNVPLPERATDDALVRALVESAVPELLAAELWGRASATEVVADPEGWSAPVPRG
jgi:glucosamine--fructose-6-phosphate aminotransferase (isomerizing)